MPVLFISVHEVIHGSIRSGGAGTSLYATKTHIPSLVGAAGRNDPQNIFYENHLTLHYNGVQSASLWGSMGVKGQFTHPCPPLVAECSMIVGCMGGKVGDLILS